MYGRQIFTRSVATTDDGALCFMQEVLKYMSSAPCIALEVRGDEIVRRFRDFCGPFDVQVARVLRPGTLRAIHGKNTLWNAVHCTDCPEDGVLECQYFFTALSS